MRLTRALLGALGLALAGCAGGSCTPAFRDCPTPTPAELSPLPPSLSATGLYADASMDKLADGVVPFAPRFPLWSDGATKRRWLYLPPETVIDTSDPDAWNFPEGTKLWKEFTSGEVRVETRLLHKRGPASEDWAAAAYVWRDDDAFLSVDGETDANGTSHDVPSAALCRGCHRGTRSGVLGVSTVQLPEVGEVDGLGLSQLASEGRLSHALPQVTVPGDEATITALGYLHANCSHCHNQRRPERSRERCFDPDNELDFTLYVGDLAEPSATATYQTAVGSVITPGDPHNSNVVPRMRSRDSWWGMPALGSEAVDVEGVALIESWILQL